MPECNSSSSLIHACAKTVCFITYEIRGRTSSSLTARTSEYREILPLRHQLAQGSKDIVWL